MVPSSPQWQEDGHQRASRSHQRSRRPSRGRPEHPPPRASLAGAPPCPPPGPSAVTGPCCLVPGAWPRPRGSYPDRPALTPDTMTHSVSNVHLSLKWPHVTTDVATQTCAHRCTRVHTQMHAPMGHTQVHTDVHTDTHMHTEVHTCTQRYIRAHRGTRTDPGALLVPQQPPKAGRRDEQRAVKGSLPGRSPEWSADALSVLLVLPGPELEGADGSPRPRPTRHLCERQSHQSHRRLQSGHR